MGLCPNCHSDNFEKDFTNKYIARLENKPQLFIERSGTKLYYTLKTDNIMIQQEKFSTIHKQIAILNQKHKCKKCGINLNVSNLPGFEKEDGIASNNGETNLHVLCIECFDLGKYQ